MGSKIAAVFARGAIKRLYKHFDENIKRAVERDAIHKSGKDFSMDLLIDRIEKFPQFRNIFLWRIDSDKKGYALKKLDKKLFLHGYPVQSTVEIHVRSGRLGAGFWLPHRYCVVNAEKIGDNVSVLQGVTIGADHKDKRPTIGNNVIIYPNAVVVGDITIGDNVYIGANAFVNFDVPAGSTVKSEPAKCFTHN